MKKLFKQLFSAALMGLWIAPNLTATQISEPDTVFYGQVINRTSGQLDLITEGNLVWTIIRPDGQQLKLTSPLMPLKNGRYSYRLLVPHQVLTYGLTVSTSAVALAAAPANCSHLSIAVDGVAASIVAPGSSSFTIAQGARAATYRLDLELHNPSASSSGDGIPDWWKARFGATDPNADGDGDGWSNLQEFLNGTSPLQDNRIPSLITTEYWVYADGLTQISLDAVDANSTPANIHYTLSTLPAGGTFYLHNVNPDGSLNDIPLSINGQFTQEDVDLGKLVFAQTDTNSTVMSFTASLSDENPANSTSVAVALNVFRPAYPVNITQACSNNASAPFGFADVPGLPFGEQQMLINYFLSRDHDYILADSARAAAARTVKAASAGVAASQDHSYVMVGGTGSDRLVGGTGSDILIGGRGNDSLRGNGGADLFIVDDTNSGNETIEDFSVENGDALDIARALRGASTTLSNYVQLTTVGTNTVVGINFDGLGQGYSQMTVTLRGVQFTSASLRALVDSGNIITGNKGFTPIVSIAATIPAASQNGPVAGQFALTRSGSIAAGLAVPLTISGSAANGSSYELISSPAVFAAGQRTLNLAVNPYLTTASLTQVVQIAVAPGSGYEVGSPASAQVTIEPLLPQIKIEAVEPYATRSDLSPGAFVITRSGIVDRSVLVRLTVGGTASTSTDYTAVSTLVNLSPNQTTALIYITPKATANVIPARFVQITVKTDPSYKVMSPGSDRVYLVEQLFTGGDWQARYFPGSTEDWAAFGNKDTGNTGIKNLHRYAFGLDPAAPSITNGLPLFRILNDRLSVTFRRPLSVTDLNYTPQISDDLLTWSSLGSEVEAFVPPGANTNDVESVSFRSKATVTAKPKQFMRVHVQPD